jgi:hypothetical protein
MRLFCSNMKTEPTLFNIYLCGLALWAAGCKTDPSLTNDESKPEKQLTVLRLHLESEPDPTGRTTQVPILRAKPMMVTIDREAFLSESQMVGAEVVDEATAGLSTDDVRLQPFLDKLQQSPDPVSVFLRTRLSAATQKAMADHDGVLANPAPLQMALVQDLNVLLAGPSIFEARRFAEVPLRAETKQLLAAKPQGAELRRLNRLLLEDAYPLEVLRSADLKFGFSIELQFNREGKWLLEECTARHRMRRIVVFAKFGPERWLAAPVTRRVISDGKLVFMPDASRDEADRIVRGLKNVIRKAKHDERFE